MALRYYDIGTATHREPTQEEFDRYRELAAQYLALRKTLALLVRDHYSVKVYDGDQLRVQLSATSEVPEAEAPGGARSDWKRKIAEATK